MWNNSLISLTKSSLSVHALIIHSCIDHSFSHASSESHSRSFVPFRSCCFQLVSRWYWNFAWGTLRMPVQLLNLFVEDIFNIGSVSDRLQHWRYLWRVFSTSVRVSDRLQHWRYSWRVFSISEKVSDRLQLWRYSWRVFSIALTSEVFVEYIFDP